MVPNRDPRPVVPRRVGRRAPEGAARTDTPTLRPFRPPLMSPAARIGTVGAWTRTGVVVMPLIRKCDKCGSLDNRATWSSADEAAKEGAFSGWTCPTCAWTEFDLVDAEEEPANA